MHATLTWPGGGTLTLYRPTATPPAVSGLVKPWLLSVEALRRRAWATTLTGLGAGEIPNTKLQVANQGGQCSRLFLYGLPLRQPVTVHDGATVLFSGLVESIELADQVITFTVIS